MSFSKKPITINYNNNRYYFDTFDSKCHFFNAFNKINK